MNFGGSITVDLSHQPKHISNITLMTFNCSTGKFSNIGIDDNFCSEGLTYHEHALVVDLTIDDCQSNGDSIPFLWVLWIFIGLVVVVVVISVSFKLYKYNQQSEVNVAIHRLDNLSNQ